VDQDGRPATRDMFNGQVTILNFMFTHCRLVCPAMTDEMSKIADRLQGTGVRFVSMSVDPEHDTPASLKQFAAIYNADHTRWKFLAGKPGVVDVIVKDGLKFALEPDPNPDNSIPLGAPGAGAGDGKGGDLGASMSNIIHPEWFVLIGRDARVLGIYRYRDSERVDELVKRAIEIDRRK
jgi:protein SCO1/2